MLSREATESVSLIDSVREESKDCSMKERMLQGVSGWHLIQQRVWSLGLVVLNRDRIISRRQPSSDLAYLGIVSSGLQPLNMRGYVRRIEWHIRSGSRPARPVSWKNASEESGGAKCSTYSIIAKFLPIDRLLVQNTTFSLPSWRLKSARTWCLMSARVFWWNLARQEVGCHIGKGISKSVHIPKEDKNLWYILKSCRHKQRNKPSAVGSNLSRHS